MAIFIPSHCLRLNSLLHSAASREDLFCALLYDVEGLVSRSPPKLVMTDMEESIVEETPDLFKQNIS